MVKEDEELDPVNQGVKILFRGKIMDPEYHVGNYISKGEILLIFKINKPAD